MIKMVLKSACLALVVLMTISLVACGSPAKVEENNTPTTGDEQKTTEQTKAAEQVKLKFYCQQNLAELTPVYDLATSNIKAQFPNVEVEYDIQPMNDDGTKLKTYAAAGQLPDIFFTTSGDISVLKTSNNILDLGPYVKESKVEEQLNDAGKGLIWDADGHCYSMPNEGPWIATFYINKKVFADAGAKVPENYDEFLAAVKTFKAKGVTPLALFGIQPWPGQQLFDALAVQGGEPGGVLKIDSGKGDFSEPAYKRAAEKMLELVNAGLISKDAFSTDYSKAQALLADGKAAMFLSGGFTMSDFSKSMKGNYDIIWCPLADKDKVDAYKNNASGGGFNQGFSVAPDSKYLDIAAKFAIQYALEYSKAKVIKNGVPNSILKNPPEPETPFDEVQKKYVAAFGSFTTTTSFPWGLANAKFKTSDENNTQKILANGYKSADEFISDMNKAIADARK